MFGFPKGSNYELKIHCPFSIDDPSICPESSSGSNPNVLKLLFFFVFYCHLKKCQYLCIKEKKPLVVRAVYAGA